MLNDTKGVRYSGKQVSGRVHDGVRSQFIGMVELGQAPWQSMVKKRYCTWGVTWGLKSPTSYHIILNGPCGGGA